jgi:hypothetical protein
LTSHRRQEYESCLAQSAYVSYDPNRILPKHIRKQNFQILSTCFGSNFRDGSLGLRHIDKGLYADQLDRWFQNFRRDQFLFLSYEQWLSDPLKYYEIILNFFGQHLFDNSLSLSHGKIDPSQEGTSTDQSDVTSTSVTMLRGDGTSVSKHQVESTNHIKTGFYSREEINFLDRNYLTTANEKKTQFSDGLMRELECFYLQYNQRVNQMLGEQILRIPNITCEEY